MIESCESWIVIDEKGSFFETQWKPKSWNTEFRFVFTGKKIKKPQKGALQLDLFEPIDRDYQYKVIVTNKTESAFTWPQGKLTLTMSSSRAVKKDLLHFMDALQKAA